MLIDFMAHCNKLRALVRHNKLHYEVLKYNSCRLLSSYSRDEKRYSQTLSHNLDLSQVKDKTKESNDGILDFNDFEKAFKAKTTFEIIRALYVYKICSYDAIVDRTKQLIKLSRRLLGKRGFEFGMSNSFYGHFVAGETQEEIKGNLALMQKYGVGAILDYAVEADIPKDLTEQNESVKKEDEFAEDLADAVHRYQVHTEFNDRREHVFSARTYFYEGEEKCDHNMEVFLQCIDTTANTAEDGFAAIKVTALGRPSLLLRLSQILNQTQFYFDKMASEKNILLKKHIAEESFIRGLKELEVDMTEEEIKKVFDIIDVSKDEHIDVIEWHNFLTPQLKLSKLFRTKPTKGKVGEEVLASLTELELKEMDNMTQRMLTIAKCAKEKGVRLMVDAEQSYFQPAISRIALEAMRFYNVDNPVVFNTYQCYMKDTRNAIEVDMELSRREGFHFAAKLVRGAYMEQERLRAASVGYPDPIHASYEDTNRCYNDVLTILLEEVHMNNANVMVATHNEASVRHTLDAMQHYNITSDQKMNSKVFFGQLLGMCDVVTYALGGAGYSAYKYVPYGPIDEVMPYLSRRAMENRSLMDGVVKERNMLWSELKRRIKSGKFVHDPSVGV